MAGSTRFELASGNNEGTAFPANYANGQRGNYSGGPNLDRSGSFRDGIESRLLGSGPALSRGNNGPLSVELPQLSQFLSLEMITIGDQKFTRSGELRRVLGVSLGSTSEDHFGAAHSKAPPIASEELKRFRASVSDTSTKARDRVKKFSDSIAKLDKYRHNLFARKRRSESSERSGGGGMLKMGSQIHKNPPDIVNQKMEERTKNVLNRRVRTSIADSEGRATAPLRQPAMLDKERDMFRANSGGPVQGEEKIRGLPAGGEGWDKKMKRKRSVGAVITRAGDSDRELKRPMIQKIPNDPAFRSSDTHSYGSGSSNGVAGNNKLDGASQSTSGNARVVAKNEPENVSLSNDRWERLAGLDKERGVTKGNIKLNVREDSQVGSSNPVTKGKASRAPRASAGAVHSSPNFHRGPGATDGWEQPPSLNKVQAVSGPNIRKRPLPTGSSSPPMAQWVGQRPQKISRTRRANLVSPVPNQDEAQTSSEGFPGEDTGGRLTPSDPNSSLISRGASTNTQQQKVKLEIAPSPARLSKSEESEAGEKSKEKGIDNDEIDDKAVTALQKVGPLMTPTKKNKMLSNEEIGDGVRRQGRSGRGSSLSRAGAPPLREKLENQALSKPLQNSRPGSDKNESKPGRPPSKKLSERKAYTRAVHIPNGVSSDFTGESDDDHEELLAAAASVHTSRNHACTGSFWKKMEPVFATVNSDTAAFLKQQLHFVEELDESIHESFGANTNILGDLVPDGVASSQPLVSRERQEIQSNGTGPSDSARCLGFGDELLTDSLCDEMQTNMKFETPLYERVLSALIAEDELEEFDQSSERGNPSFFYASDGSPCANGNRFEPEIESDLDFRPQKPFMFDSLSCDGSTASNSFKSPSMRYSSYSDELLQGDDSLIHQEFGDITGYDQCIIDGSQHGHTNISGIASVERQYEQMSVNEKVLLELQSIGLFPETVFPLFQPDLAEGEEDDINKDIIALKKNLYQQAGQKKRNLLKIDESIRNGRDEEERDLEKEAMHKLVEMAYKKLMACRGSSASKSGVLKVSKQAAMAFVKRTIARCRKSENTGKSCFSEPALRNIVFSGLVDRIDAKSADAIGATATSARAHASQSEPKTSGVGVSPPVIRRHGPQGDKLERGSLDALQIPHHSSSPIFQKYETLSNRGKKKEVLLDDVAGGIASRSTPAPGSGLMGGAKGRRTERERDQNKVTTARNSVPKVGRPALGGYRGDRKTKTKPKQKTAQLSTSGNGLLGRVTETTCPVYPSARGSSDAVTNVSGKISRETGTCSLGNVPQGSSIELEEPFDFSNLPLSELDCIGDLGASNNPGAPQDLTSWFNFDEESLQDHDSMGLDIPMDDLQDIM
ncbi:uncharacterized protein LOC113323422 isoform X1 [Papaver somniferum]|uniref:uncharacterized protein LOC113323422 isoform X1 n=1 Tax=Papaver somniferum TaxID=3469 RepID=UPI000E6FB8D4|nr:uncharacterized protein LOC113323422 isoform X1 [Papaver somniferum]XP_026427512.1 uncharacterized protein LOC113323422 isoform X1 [Papaver somniferum]XP_026427513.1 uncharacterized protein LOC113323422 isoform X1 [Papaver somniferum]XP_026427514.1 uncharacterized protein LOC113323422 isoform X1 [Papaver somniferum]XP_026427515.1 uncharacterized protein LOC113323422 isoform X1 [Papaver somniferum]